MNKQKVVLKRGTFKHIEDELYAYHQTKKAIADLRRDIIEGSPMSDGTGIRSSEPGNPTHNKAVRLVDSKLLSQMEKTVAAIDYVMSKLPEEKINLVKLKYWQGHLTDLGIQVKLNLSRRTYYRWKADIVIDIARQIGWH